MEELEAARETATTNAGKDLAHYDPKTGEEAGKIYREITTIGTELKTKGSKMGGDDSLWFNQFDIGLLACAELAIANPQCKRCTAEDKEAGRCTVVEQLFNYATRGDLNCGCPNKDSGWNENVYDEVDIIKITSKTTKTEIKAGENCELEVIQPENNGVEYKGAQNVTRSGKECQAWAA